MPEQELREVIARATTEFMAQHLCGCSNLGCPWYPDRTFGTSAMCQCANPAELSDAVLEVLAARVPDGIDAGIERLGEAAFEYGKTVIDYIDVFPNGFRDDAFDEAETALKALIAAATRPAVRVETPRYAVAERLVKASVRLFACECEFADVAGAEGACSELRDLWDQAVIDYNAALAPAPED